MGSLKSRGFPFLFNRSPAYIVDGLSNTKYYYDRCLCVELQTVKEIAEMAQRKSEKPKKVKLSRKQQETYANIAKRESEARGKKKK